MIARRAVIGGLGAGLLLPRRAGAFTPPPNDPNYANQWHLTQISAPQAWALSQGSSSTIIAFLGTGNSLSTDNPVTQVAGFNFPANTSNTSDVSTNPGGHDSIVIDLAMGATNDGAGSAGVCPVATLMPLVVVAANQSISNLYVGQALAFAATNGAHILSCSFVFPNPPPSYLTPFCQQVWNAGGIIVAATGDSPGSCINDFYDPAQQDNVIGVGTVTSADIASSSNCPKHIKLVAPGGGGGVGLCATDDRPVTGCGLSASTGADSWAVPIVSGVLGLMRTANSKITLRNDELYNLITRYGCDAIQGIAGWPTLDPTYGYGRVNALKAVTAAASYVRPFPVRSATVGGL